MANENLLANVLQRYNEGLAASPKIRALQRARDRVLTSREVQDAAGEAGEILGQALTDALSSLAGDGQVTLEQALSLVPPSLRRNHSFLSSLIRRLDKTDGLKTAVPPFDAERAKNLAKRAASYERFADHTLDFSELVENNSRAVVDDAERETADARYRMGLSPRIRRRQVGGCCEWCAKVEGEFAYDPQTMDKRVFRRHRGCDCLIELIRDGRREVVDNYTSWDKRNDQAELRQRIRLLEPDSDYPSPGELIRRRQDGESDPQNRGVIAGRILRGEYSLKYKHQKYLQHVKDTPQYQQTARQRGKQQSYLIITEQEAKSIVYRLCGTGAGQIDENGTFEPREYVDIGHVVGYYYDTDRVEHKTDRVMILYAKEGTHIVPVKPLEGGGL